jgi:hypothetical protein
MNWWDIVQAFLPGGEWRKYSVMNDAAQQLSKGLMNMDREALKSIVSLGGAVLGGAALGAGLVAGGVYIAEKIKVWKLNREIAKQKVKEELRKKLAIEMNRMLSKIVTDLKESGDFSVEKVRLSECDDYVERTSEGRTFIGVKLPGREQSILAREIDYDLIDPELDRQLNNNVNRCLVL